MNPVEVQHRLQEFLAMKLAASGKTQLKLSGDLNVSLPTCKRWLKGRGVGFENIASLAQALRFDLAELGEFLSKSSTKQFMYNEQQESHLSENLELLVVFDGLHRGSSASQIRKKFQLSILGMNRLLKELEEIGLIERLPFDDIRIVPEGEPTWRRDGALRRAMHDALLDRITQRAKEQQGSSIGLMEFSKSDEREVRRLAKEWMAFASECDERTRRAKKGEKRAFAIMTAMVPMALEDLMN